MTRSISQRRPGALGGAKLAAGVDLRLEAVQPVVCLTEGASAHLL